MQIGPLKRHIIRRVLKIFWLAFVAAVSVIIAGALIIQLPQVQTAVADKVVHTLSEKLDGNITFEKIHFKPFTTLVLKNTVIIDKNPASDAIDPSAPQIDTFFRAEYIIAKISLDGLLDKESIKIDRVYVGNAQMNLVLEDFAVPVKGDKQNNLSRIFRIEKDRERPEPKAEEIFNIRDIEIRDMGFALINRSSDKVDYHGEINWNDLDIKDINLTAKGLRFEDGIMYGTAEALSFREKTGFTVHQMSGSTRVGRGKTIIEDLEIHDEWSDLKLPVFIMSYADVKSFEDFIALVKLDGEIATSILDFRTIVYFAPQLKGNELKATISGTMSGYVNDFVIKNIVIDSHDGGFKGTVNGRMTGVPDVENMRIDASVSKMQITAEGLGRFVSEWTRGKDLDFSKIGKGVTFTADATARGLLNNLDTQASLVSDAGDVLATVRLDEIISEDKPIVLSGHIMTKDLDIGRMLGNDIVGPVSISTGLSASLKEQIEVDLDSLRIDRLNFKGYNYSDIQARGRYDGLSMNGTVISKDPNLNFIFQGGYAKSEKSRNTVYKFNASVGYADLHAINIDRRGESIVQLRTNANFTRTGKGNLLGRIDIGDIMLENKGGRYEVGDVIFTSNSADNKYTARLNSKFAKGTYSGSASLGDFINDLKGVTIDREIPALTADSGYTWSGNTYELDFICHDIQNILSFAVPGLYIENGTSLSASIDAKGDFTADLSSGRFAFKKNYIKGFSLKVDNAGNALNGIATCNEISAASIVMNDNLLQIHANDNHIGAGFSFDNHSDSETKGEFIVNSNVSREDDSRIFDIRIMPSSLHYNSKEWNIQPSGIRIQDNDISIDSFGAISGEQSISLHGRASDYQGDILSLNLERFDLSIINSLLPKDFGIKGAVTGTASLTSPISDRAISVDILCDSSYVANIPMGELKLAMKWNEEAERFDFQTYNHLQDKKSLDISGNLYPKSKQLYAAAEFNSFDVGYPQPFLKDIFSEMHGNLYGNIELGGPFDMLKIRSNSTRLEDVTLKIGYTGVPYKVNGPFHLDEMGVYFDNIAVSDRFDGIGTVNGSINYDHFRDIKFDTRIKVNQIEAINLGEDDNETFYGHLFGSGDIAITGPLQSIVMDIDAATGKSGNLHIPITSSLTSSKGTNLLKFKDLDTYTEIDPYEIFVQRTTDEDKSENDFLVRLNVNADQNTEAFVEIDKSSGNVLSGRGNGQIRLEASEDIFNINGDYTLDSGNYKFVAIGLVSRDFLIQQGSTIRFAGDIMDSSLDIDAVYRTKASLSTLISDTTSVANRRVVDCGISIQDKLSNPQLSFSIEIPDLDPTIKSRVESALSTEDKVQKQFLSLIISNNFLPDEQSGIVNNTSALYNNVTELMANQLNNIFQKLDIPLDLGLKYQPNERGNDIFDVAVSTQLFNNRVVVNGNIGNKQYSSGNSQNEVVGDIEIEIKLDRSGSFRLNLFSHSADQYTNYLDNSQRNGVGVTYQTEFNTLKQFFKNIFSSRQKRQAARLAEEQARIGESRTVIYIE